MVDVNLRGVLHGIAAALPVFRRQGRGHFVPTVSTAGLKIVPTMAVYAATKNAVRTTSISPGFVDTQLDSSIDNAAVREQVRRTMNDFGLRPSAVARAIAFAIEQPDDTEIGDITIRPTAQG
jgi:NADP-dependent 3-hydroxy acid dehydrogenase YdfG